MNFNFSEHSSDAITGSKTAIDSKLVKNGGRRLFNKYDLLFGEDAANETQFPTKIGYQGYYFNGSQLLSSIDYFELPQSFTFEIWFKFTEPLYVKKNPRYSLFKLYSPSYKNETEPYIKMEIQYGMGFALYFQDKRVIFDPDLNFEYDYVNRWSFLGISVMNLKDDEVKVCYAFPPNIFDCSTKY